MTEPGIMDDYYECEKGDEEVNAVDNPSVMECDPKHHKRYILFVGSLRFKTTKENLEKYFTDHDAPPTSIRLLTDKKTGKPRGCAFVEFDGSIRLSAALELHHTMLDGRRINVELTAGGGGKSEVRQLKIKEKNDRLSKERDSSKTQGVKKAKK